VMMGESAIGPERRVQDTIGSVPDAKSRSFSCDAPTNLAANLHGLDSSEYGVGESY
jgi:hypothetical protein